MLRRLAHSRFFKAPQRQTSWAEWEPQGYHYRLNVPGKSFIPSSFGQGAKKFVRCHPPHTFLQRGLKDLLTSFLGYTHVDASAALNFHKMFVLDKTMAASLLKVDSHKRTTRSYLDVGAGDGAVTSEMASLFSHVTATEASEACHHTLSKNPMIDRAYLTTNLSSLVEGKHRFDVVSLFNVLDRCNKPKSLLAEACECLKLDGGKMIVAMVYPYRPFVVENKLLKQEPEERIFPTAALGEEPLHDSTFEAFCEAVLTGFFQPAGLSLYSYTRVPYMCQNNDDMGTPFSCLDCAIFVLERRGVEER
jgi:hypothetical protein